MRNTVGLNAHADAAPVRLVNINEEKLIKLSLIKDAKPMLRRAGQM